MGNIRDLIEEQRKLYKKIKSVYCYLLGEPVYFTSSGFNHLLYKPRRVPRSINEQYMKLKCLKFVPRVIQNCPEISETRHARKWIKNRKKEVVYYELVYEVYRGKKIRVII